jgi:hypothetical protein
LAADEHLFDWGAVLYFSRLGQLQYKSDGRLDPDRSPAVTVRVPRVRRGLLWTTGEVRFCPVPLNQFPELERLRRTFLRWFGKFPLVYDHRPGAENKFNYYLECSAVNYGQLRAFPTGLLALENGQYFISFRDTDFRVDKLCRTLALRGVTCAGQD